MIQLTKEQFELRLKHIKLSKSFRSQVNFERVTQHLSEADWHDTELLAIADRSGTKGVLLAAPYEELYMLPYELRGGITDAQTGRARSIICDFCRTWQTGAKAASITFSVSQSNKTVRFLCCEDLACSRHARGLTKASLVSKSQLREDITPEGRIRRLKANLAEIIIGVA